jgi:hypothetical protein
MFPIIQNIVSILNSYTNGKLFENKKEKRERKGRVKDVVSISDEARKRCNSGDDEVTSRNIDEMYMK